MRRSITLISKDLLICPFIFFSHLLILLFKISVLHLREYNQLKKAIDAFILFFFPYIDKFILDISPSLHPSVEKLTALDNYGLLSHTSLSILDKHFFAF